MPSASRRAAGALLCLLAVAAAAAPAAAAGCGETVAKATKLCRSEMIEIVWAAQAGGAADPAALSPSKGCCAAAAAVFSAEFGAACGCDAALLEQTAATTPAAVDALRAMVAAKCDVAPADVLALPTCAAPLVAAARAAAYGVSTAGAPLSAAPLDKNRPPPSANDTTPKAGPGSRCTVATKCSTSCEGSSTNAKASFQKKVAKCSANRQRGLCVNGTVSCGANGTEVHTFFNKTNAFSGKLQKCFTCCQPLGDVYSTSRGRWYEGVNMCSDRAAACFPGDATVALRGGATKAMRDLAVGDSILVLKADGSAAFEDVYFFDHQVDGGSHSFVKLNLADGSSLELTSGHFVPVGESLAAAVMKRAGAVAEGEPLLVMSGGGAEAVIVASIEAITKPGLFAPVTASGTLVVGGVVASAYSDWVLDPLFDALGATASLPAAMHAVHAPLRLAYSILGARAMAALSPLVSGIAMLDTAQIAAGLGLSVSA